MRGEAEAHDNADQHHDLGGHQNLPLVVEQERKRCSMSKMRWSDGLSGFQSK